jgi:PAS domain S-box-containing protein
MAGSEPASGEVTLPMEEHDMGVPTRGEFDRCLQQTATESSPLAQLVVDADGLLTIVNERARALFGLRSSDAGQPIRDLQLSSDPVELCLLIEMAEAERRSVFAADLYWPSQNGEDRWLDLQIVPLIHNDGVLIGTALTFADVTANHLVRQALEQSQQQLEAAFKMLRSINRALEIMNKELRAINDELQRYLREEGRHAVELAGQWPEAIRQVYVRVRHTDEHWDEREQFQPGGTGTSGVETAGRRTAVHLERGGNHRTLPEPLDH